MQNQGLMQDFWRRYGWTIAWAALLFTLSSIPDLSPPFRLFDWDDKLHHLLAYMPLGWLLMRAIVWKEGNIRKALWLAIVLGTLYGMSDEFHQHFVPGRTMDANDLLADMLGVALGGWLFRRRRKPAPAEKSTADVKRKTPAAK